METPPKRRRGRPEIPSIQRKRNNVTIRLRDALKKQLEETAHAEGRSLSEEIEYRLENSFLEEENLYRQFGGRAAFEFCRALATFIDGMEKLSELNPSAIHDSIESKKLSLEPTWPSEDLFKKVSLEIINNKSKTIDARKYKRINAQNIRDIVDKIADAALRNTVK